MASRWNAAIRLSACLLLCLAGSAIACPAAPAATARPADSFVDSIGVAVHFDYTDTPYGDDFTGVEQRILQLGIRHVRSDLTLDNPTEYQRIKKLGEDGVGATLILGDPDAEESALDEMLTTVKTTLAGSVDAVEGPNEYSTRGGPEWVSKLTAYQRRLYETVKSDPALSSLPVIGPSIVHGDQQALGDVSSWLDYGNIHSYPEGNPPEYRMGAIVKQAEYNSAKKPIIATETGYTNALEWAPSGPGENKPISEEGAGIYAPRLFFEYFTRHIARTFNYELVDEHPNTELDEREEHFGLLRNNLSPKPAYESLRNTIAILANPGPAFSPDSLEYSVSEDGATLHKLLLEKRNGTFYLALWRLESVWNPDTKEALSFNREPVTVSVPGGIDSYSVYVPSTAASPVFTSASPTGQLEVDVGPEVTIVALTPHVESSPSEPPTEEPSSEEPPTLLSEALAAPLLPLSPEPATRRCVVPDLTGMKVPQARRRARTAGCGLGAVTRRAGATRDGRVSAQHPGPGAVRPLRARIRVAIGGRQAARAGLWSNWGGP